MKTENLVLLPLTVHGTPSGTYDGSSTTFAGLRQKAVSYYRTKSGVQSVRFRADDFVGVITIQATLDADPQDDAQWFTVYTFPGDSTDHSTATSADFSTALTGNFVWMRARVTNFLSGTITSVVLTY